MRKTQDNPRRTLGHLKRLMREGEDLLLSRPLDEFAHALWYDRAEKYLNRKMPELKIPPPDQLVSIEMPDLLASGHQRSHPIDAAFARASTGGELVGKLMAILASAIERLELKLESEEE